MSDLELMMCYIALCYWYHLTSNLESFSYLSCTLASQPQVACPTAVLWIILNTHSRPRSTWILSPKILVHNLLPATANFPPGSTSNVGPSSRTECNLRRSWTRQRQTPQGRLARLDSGHPCTQLHQLLFPTVAAMTAATWAGPPAAVPIPTVGVHVATPLS